MTEDEDAFARHRNLLFTVAYEMLGSASDAEDVVQETWPRWADVDQSVVREPENGRITHIYAIRNPHKLARLDAVSALTRT